MKIHNFTIENYRSIKRLHIENLSEVNVFFGENNVGKSNIIRGLHLAFYSLKADSLYLPDTLFYNRIIYLPIKITVDISLGEGFYLEEKETEIMESIGSFSYMLSPEVRSSFGDDFLKLVDRFIELSYNFKALEKIRLHIHLDYNGVHYAFLTG